MQAIPLIRQVDRCLMCVHWGQRWETTALGRHARASWYTRGAPRRQLLAEGVLPRVPHSHLKKALLRQPLNCPLVVQCADLWCVALFLIRPVVLYVRLFVAVFVAVFSIPSVVLTSGPGPNQGASPDLHPEATSRWMHCGGHFPSCHSSPPSALPSPAPASRPQAPVGSAQRCLPHSAPPVASSPPPPHPRVPRPPGGHPVHRLRCACAGFRTP